MTMKTLIAGWLVLLAYALGHLQGLSHQAGLPFGETLVALAGAAVMAFADVWPAALLGGIALTATYLIADRLADRLAARLPGNLAS